MSSSQPPHEGPAPDSPADVRTLPARPSLEFERKQAKKLVAQIRRGNAEALARVHAKLKGSADRKPPEFKLADAQFTIAREYGFTSWPRLVEYFEILARHEASGAHRESSARDPDLLAQSIMRGHRDKLSWTAGAIASFVPRFFNRRTDDVFASEITVEEARLVAARMRRYPSWEAMLANLVPERDLWARDDSPIAEARRAIRNKNLAELERLMTAHPDLLKVSTDPARWWTSLAYAVVHGELRSPSESRELSEWLATKIDLTPDLNWLLLGYWRMRTSDLQWLLDHAADPNWVPPNGISVLEHAIYRCWNGEAVDLIAQRVKPRKAFWISAGLGDAEAVARYVRPDGSLTDAARQNRPDFTALGPLPAANNPAADDREIIWEAFLVAGWNSRLAVLDVLLDRGFPIDHAPWGQPLLHFGIYESRVPLVEFLVRRGADLDFRGWHPNITAREAAEDHFADRPDRPEARRILELCGGRDPDVVLRERDEQRAKRVMQTAPTIEEAFVLAKRDAVHRGLTAVSPESLFVGLLRRADLSVSLLGQAGVNLPKLRALIGERFNVDAEPPAEMTADPEANAILMAARAEAEQRKAYMLNTLHVMYALLQRAPGSVLDMLNAADGSKEKVLDYLETILKQS